MTLLSNEVEKVKAKDFFQLPVDILWSILQSECIKTSDDFSVVSGRSWEDGSGHFMSAVPKGLYPFGRTWKRYFLCLENFYNGIRIIFYQNWNIHLFLF